MATPILLAQLNGNLTYENAGAGGTGTGTGALRYRDGHTGGVQGALVEEATTNHARNPSFETNVSDDWQFNTRAHLTTDAVVGTDCMVVTTSNGSPGTAVGTVALIAAVSGNTFALSAYCKLSSGGPNMGFWMSQYNGAAFLTNTASSGAVNVLTGSWERKSAILTLDNASANGFKLAIGNPATSAAIVSFRTDAVQIEQKDHVTTYCDGDLGTGYAWTGTAHNSTSTRTAAKIELPTALPTWVAFRYREAETGAMTFASITTLTGNNVGTYGKISHDGADLVIESDRLLVIGPVMAGTGTLTAYGQNVLDTTDTWTMDMVLDEPEPEPETPASNNDHARNRQRKLLAILIGGGSV